MSLTGLDKTPSSSLVGQDKNLATLLGIKKAGLGWDYNQSDITYNATSDSEGRAVLYNALGFAVTLTGLDKHLA